MLHAGETFDARTIVLPVASTTSVVRVSAESQVEIAQEQLNLEEKQRVLGVIPNYYVSYDPNAVPLTARQKYQLAWKTSIDPMTWFFSGRLCGRGAGHQYLCRIRPGRAGLRANASARIMPTALPAT